MDKKIVFIIAFLIYITSTYFSYSFFSGGNQGELKSPLSSYKTPRSNSVEIPSEPKTEECPINGEMLTKTQKEKWEKRRPLGVMVENHLDARPQSGLTLADVIYETVAEGGITRFLTIFYCKDADPVGPVRSARIYFIKLLQSYGNNPLYAHVGGANTDGAADALGEISELGWAQYNDLNQFSVPFPNFWRDYERLPNRDTEHTVYTSTKKLWDYAKDKRKLTNVDSDEITWDATFTNWEFKDEASTAKRGDLTKISFGFWSSFADQYNVSWIYDKQNNSFKRENGGQLYVDKNTGNTLEAKNVMIAFMQESSANDGYEGGHILYKTVGQGKAIVFQDGFAIDATWKRADENSLIKFYNTSGQEIPIVRGQVFIEILPVGNKVVY